MIRLSTAMAGIPPALATDPEDVAWALQTADALWKRNERDDAIVWLRRAAQAAAELEDDDCALALARDAAELTERSAHRGFVSMSLPPGVAADDLEEMDELDDVDLVPDSTPSDSVDEVTLRMREEVDSDGAFRLGRGSLAATLRKLALAKEARSRSGPSGDGRSHRPPPPAASSRPPSARVPASSSRMPASRFPSPSPPPLSPPPRAVRRRLSHGGLRRLWPRPPRLLLTSRPARKCTQGCWTLGRMESEGSPAHPPGLTGRPRPMCSMRKRS